MPDVFFIAMNTVLNRYKVHFKGLEIGQHILNFDVDKSFFDQFEDSEVTNGSLEVEIELDKHTNMLELNFFIEGNVEVQCDRCLEPFTIPVEYEGKLVVRISDTIEEKENDDEIWFVNSNEHEVNLAHYIYESICLSLPIQRYHGILGTSQEVCDKEMLRRLNMLSNNETKASDQKPKTDSRWDKLKDIL